MATLLESNKTKIAKRVIEVFEFFDETNAKATVMDIVRRYRRPQSSTSELLASLVEMGLLYKDARSRSYSPTPRLATLGTAAQPEIIRDGRLFAFMDRLAFSTRHAVALFGMIGTHAQIFRWSPGSDDATRDLGCGASQPLSASAAGLLLLSTYSNDHAGRMLWRLNAEAPDGAKFNPAELRDRVADYRRQGHATGAAGFVPAVRLTATLLPCTTHERPLALGVFHPDAAAVDTDALVATLGRGIAQCASPEEETGALAAAGPFMMAVAG
ncbi:helix-turn-helix domain-containing protein [Sphingomonas bacterium]|uniref:helix-turn-helix domain-containing protein n=1 Tax=Sphingomonas bacterium TaxID=1895847 RepID=UPI001576817F|nr:helix-turn-helix domain-containing protein [Sphingomonas bacterium]